MRLLFFVVIGSLHFVCHASDSFPFEGTWVRTDIRCVDTSGDLMYRSRGASMTITLKSGQWNQSLGGSPSGGTYYVRGRFKTVAGKEAWVLVMNRQFDQGPLATWRGGNEEFRFSMEGGELVETTEFKCGKSGLIQWIYEFEETATS